MGAPREEHSYEKAVERQALQTKKAEGLPSEFIREYASYELALSPAEAEALDPFTLQLHLAFRDGLHLGEWVARGMK